MIFNENSAYCASQCSTLKHKASPRYRRHFSILGATKAHTNYIIRDLDDGGAIVIHRHAHRIDSICSLKLFECYICILMCVWIVSSYIYNVFMFILSEFYCLANSKVLLKTHIEKMYRASPFEL